MESFLSVQTQPFHRFAPAPKVPPVMVAVDASYPKPFKISAATCSAGVALTVVGSSIFIARRKRAVAWNKCRHGVPIAVASSGVLAHPEELDESELETTEEIRTRILAAWERERQKKIVPLTETIDQMLNSSAADLKYHVDPTLGAQTVAGEMGSLEVWRADVKDARRAAFFIRVWADEFFAKGKKKFRFGIRTPVQWQYTTSGVLFKFRPLKTLKEVEFEDLDEGGLEFIAEAPDSLPPRIRIVRSHYGKKAILKINSEKALIDKFAREWAIVEETSKES